MARTGFTQAIDANGARIPLLGLGTWELRGRVCARVVEQALRLGYRHVATAQMYDNEREVGQGNPASRVLPHESFLTTNMLASRISSPRHVDTATERLQP